MPRKLLRRWLPHPKNVTGTASSSWLAPLVDDPNLLHLNRHSVSGAVFIGLFCAFLPLPGQALVAALLAFWFRCNLPISLLLIWISNPLTIPPLMILLYQFGQLILGNEPGRAAFEFTWSWFRDNGGTVYLPIVVGGLVAGLAAGSMGYITIRMLWRWRVVSDWEARKKKRLRNHS